MRRLSFLKQDDIAELQRLLPEWASVLADLTVEKSGFAFAGRYGEELLGIGGVILNGMGAGHCWMIVAPTAREYPRVAFQLIRSGLDQARRTADLWRLEAHVSCNDPVAIKTIQVLGFQREGRARAYMPDKTDAYIYSWVEGRQARKVIRRKEKSWSGLL